MKCRECNTEIQENWRYCPLCQTELTQMIEDQKRLEDIRRRVEEMRTQMHKKISSVISCTLVGLIIFLLLIVGFNNSLKSVISSNDQESSITLLPGVSEFLKQNPHYGTLKETTPQPDWANGKRQVVNTSTGRYLFYTYNNEVVTVIKYEVNGEQKDMYRKEILQPKQAPKHVSATADIPSYKILFEVNLASGEGKFGEILIASYSRNTPKEDRESTLRYIMKKEGLAVAYLYSTEDAYKANNSEAYSKQNPNAMKLSWIN